MPLTRWFRVVNWSAVVAPFRRAARKAPQRKPARPTLWPELLENRTVPSAGALQPALLVEPGVGSPAPAANTGQPTQAGPAQSTSQGDQGAGNASAGPAQQVGPAQNLGPTQPGGPAQNLGPAQNPGPAQPGGPAQNPGPAQPVGPAQQGGPGQQGGPADGGPAGDNGNGPKAQDAGPAQQGGPADSGPAGDGGNGHKAQDGGKGHKAQDGGNGQQGVPGALFSSDQGHAGGENRPAAPGVNATAEVVPFASAVPAGSPAAIDALFAAAPVEAGPVGVPANASSTAGTAALVGSDLAAQLSKAGSVPDAGSSMGALPGTNLLGGTLDQAPLPRPLLQNAELSLSGASNPSDFSRFLNGDGAFLELWDRDQLLFPDSLPKVDELQFPGRLPWGQEMPLPERTPNLGGPLSLSEQPVEVPIRIGAVGEAVESAPALPDGQEAIAEPALAANPDSGPALSPADPSGAPADRLDTGRGKDPLRPYKIALGLVPVLAAFGFTAVTLREQVLAGRRRWQELRGR